MYARSTHGALEKYHYPVPEQNGEVPIDNSAAERALRNSTIDRKNWMTINTVRGYCIA